MKKSLLLFMSFALTACGFSVTTIPQKTLTPALTTTPAPTPTPTPTLTATPVPNGPCDNPLVPLGTGNQWTYRVTTTSGESDYSLKSLGRQDGANIVALVEYSDQKNNLSVQDLVICQDGAIENYPLFVMNMLFSDYLNKYIDTYHESGVYAPNYQSLIQNNWTMNWQADYLTEDEAYIKNPSGGPDLLILLSTPVELSFHLDSVRESVNAPAGNFPQALKITQDFSLNVTITSPGSGTGTSDTLTLMTTQWYEPYIGLVRARIDSASLSGGYSIPIESTVELVEFAPEN
jgi:hypothetical protein